MTLKKPKYCGQNWLDMIPTENGRICGGCQKEIFDFSKKSFAEIKEIQEANNNALCAMYPKDVIANWNSTKPIQKFNSLNAILAVSALIATSGQAISQEIPKTEENTEQVATDVEMILPLPTNTIDSIYATIEGQVTTLGEGGKLEFLPFAKISLKNHHIQTQADSSGRYKIEIKIDQYQQIPEQMHVECVDYRKFALVFDSIPRGKTTFDPQLTRSSDDIINYYVEEPTKWKRFQWKIRKLFSRKKP